MNTLDTKVITKRIHVFKAGEQTSAQGVQRKFSPEDLQQVVDTYDPDIHEAPLVIGHAGDNDSHPAYGWIKNFERQGDNLYANVEFTDAAKGLVKNKHYKKVSISFYSPDSQINPHKGQWSARHLALLGAAPPAVKGLEAFSFGEDEGVFDYAAALSPQELFDEDLGPTLIEEKSPLEMLREKLEEVKHEMTAATQELEENSNQQQETNVAEEATPADNANTNNPNQQFSEMQKKMGREGAEKSEIAQQTANLETQAPEEEFMENGKISRKKAKGAHGAEVQVVEELHAEAEDNKKQMTTEHSESDSTDHGEFGRGETARSQNEGYADRQKVGKGAGEDREGVTKNAEQENDRMLADEKSVKDAEQENDRKDASERAVKSGSDAVGEDRWAGQEDTGKKRAMDNDQYGDAAAGLEDVSKPGTSTGSDPHGRDGGSTKVASESEESPDSMDITVSLQSTKGNKTVRVMHQSSSDGRAPVKGGPINHAEGEVPAETTTKDGVTAKKAVAEEHSESKDPFTKTGKGSTYGQKEEDEDEEGEEKEYSESQDFCGDMNYGMAGASASQAAPMGMNPMYEELMALKAENDRLKREYQEQQMSVRRDKIARFVENLYSEGKVTDAIISQSELQSYCEGLEFGTLEFAEGETPATKLLTLLDRLPNMVYFGEVVGAGPGNLQDEDLDPHTRALKMVENGEASDYVEAIKKAMFTSS